MDRKKLIPASCAGLDLQLVCRELIRSSGHVTKAAERLGVPAPDLRMLIRIVPRVMEAALEVEEQALDEAEAVVRRAMKSSDLGRRLEAAGYMLKTNPAAQRRWGDRKSFALTWREPVDNAKNPGQSTTKKKGD
jgi:hypothetical protein